MGKYISTENRKVAPIFPKMPSAQQRFNEQSDFRAEVERKREEERVQKNISVNKNTPAKAESAPVSEPNKKHLTSSDLRQGFKMSIILGEPVSRKYRYGRKIIK